MTVFPLMTRSLGLLTVAYSSDNRCSSFNTARRTLRGFEAMNMIRKGQVQGVKKGDVRGSIELVSQLFGIAQ